MSFIGRVSMPFIVFCGLPGSGKTTLARAVSERAQLPVLDKDDFLEALFEKHGIGDGAWRTKLSREADGHFASAARTSAGACLVSWWRPSHVANPSGTPADWLFDLNAPVVQVHCNCRVETAVGRFISRQRHPGHRDGDRTAESLHVEFAGLAGAVPMRDAAVIEVDTDQPVDVDALMDRIHVALGSNLN